MFAASSLGFRNGGRTKWDNFLGNSIQDDLSNVCTPGVAWDTFRGQQCFLLHVPPNPPLEDYFPNYNISFEPNNDWQQYVASLYAREGVLQGPELETFAKGGFYVTSPRPGLTLGDLGARSTNDRPQPIVLCIQKRSLKIECKIGRSANVNGF